MKTLTVVVIAVALAGGCGGEGDDASPTSPPPVQQQPPVQQPAAKPEAALRGAWFAEAANGCVIGWAFDGTHSYERSILCRMPDGRLSNEVQRGMYLISRNEIYFTPSHTSCPDIEPGAVAIARYSVTDPSTLVLEDDEARIVLALTPSAPGANAVIVFGCFRDGKFTPGPVSPVTP